MLIPIISYYTQSGMVWKYQMPGKSIGKILYMSRILEKIPSKWMKELCKKNASYLSTIQISEETNQ